MFLCKLTSYLRQTVHNLTRRGIAILPRGRRFEVFRSFVDCDPPQRTPGAEDRRDPRRTRSLLHPPARRLRRWRFMTPDLSGMRVTIYHALPTTTTLCAKIDDRVVGTISLIRESALGFPLQRIFDLTAVRAKEGNIAEVSASRKTQVPPHRRQHPLSADEVHVRVPHDLLRHPPPGDRGQSPAHRDVRIAALFQRLSANVVENYDFVNGARRWRHPGPAGRP